MMVVLLLPVLFGVGAGALIYFANSAQKSGIKWMLLGLYLNLIAAILWSLALVENSMFEFGFFGAVFLLAMGMTMGIAGFIKNDDDQK